MPNKFVALNTEVAETRTETLMGREHLVVPVVALLEMVIHSSTSETPELALAEEFGKLPLAWNGRPVVINHPELNGQKVSANLTEVVETEKIGEIYNSHLDDDKLKMEAWIDLARVEELGGVAEEMVEKLQSGDEMIEVSTGLFADLEKKDGSYEGKKYSGVWRNVIPDHLAILSDSKGACSIEDGCGAPRHNEDAVCACEGTDDPCDACKAKLNEKNSIFAAFKAVKDEIIRFIPNRRRLSDMDKRRLLQSALETRFGQWTYLEAVFSKTIVYQTDDGLFELGYQLSSGSVTFDDDPIPVVAEVNFVPLKVNDDGSIEMDKEKFVSKLIGNTRSKFSEDDREWLLALEEDQLTKLEPVEEAPKQEATSATPEADPSTTSEEEEEEEEPEAITAEQYLQNAPDEVRSVLNEGMKLQKARRAELVETILANEKNKFTEEQLSGMETDFLANLADMAETEDYAGRGSVRAHERQTDAPAPMPAVFDAKKKTA